MRNLFAKLWNDDRGNVAFEYLALVTIVGLGLIVGFAGLRNALVTEYTELGSAILHLNQSYSYSGLSGCSSTVGGGNSTDTPGDIEVNHRGATGGSVDAELCP